MKKLLLALSLGTLSSVVLAQAAPIPAPARPGPIGIVSFDADTGSHVFKGTLVQPTPYGSFDANMLLVRPRTGAPAANGFEVGYGNGTSFGRVGIRARIAYGDTFSGGASYYWAGVEASVPVTQRINAFASYRRRGGIGSSTAVDSNRYTLGADVGISKTWSVRVGAYQNRPSVGVNRTGVTTALLYRF